MSLRITVSLRQGCVTRRLIPATLVAMTMATTMTAVKHSEPAGLQSLARRFMTWRTIRPRGQRIPTELWQAATAVARIHGINPTVAALKLNYYDLQRRMQSGRALRGGRCPTPVFVELPPVPVAVGRDERGPVEVVQANGARLILRLAATRPAELLPLVKLFLRSRP